MTAKPTSERMAALRQRREALGLTRLELWTHPLDAPLVKKYASKMAKKRKREDKNA